MHTILRAFVSSTSLLLKATDVQADKPGVKKAVATVWAELPMLASTLISVAEELLDDPTLGNGEAQADEAKWLKAFIDEVGTPGDGPVLREADSWATLTRSTAWLAFCLDQASAYAQDADYSKDAFRSICTLLSTAEAYEKAMAFAAITEAGTRFESLGESSAKAVAETYDKLLDVLH